MYNEGCGSQRSRRKKTGQSVACFLLALSFPASPAHAIQTPKPICWDWALLTWGPLQCWKELGSVAVSIPIVCPLNLGQPGMGEQVNLCPPSPCSLWQGALLAAREQEKLL